MATNGIAELPLTHNDKIEEPEVSPLLRSSASSAMEVEKGNDGEFVPASFLSPAPTPANQTQTTDSQKLTSFQLNLAQLNQIKDWTLNRRQNIRPWTTFVNTNRVRKPRSAQQLGRRVMRNVEHFQSNYLFVFLGLFLYCILTSPILLIVLATSLGACYIVSLKNRESKVQIGGREVTLTQQFGLVFLCSVPLFWLAGAGSAIFWIIGASFLTILLHAALYSPEDENPEDLFEMEHV